MTREKLLDRIAKLRRHAESARAIGNEAEAEAFVAKMTAILAEHKLSMDEVDLREQDAVDPLGWDTYRFDREDFNPDRRSRPKRPVIWMDMLARAATRLNFCKAINTKHGPYIAMIFIGRKSDVDRAKWLYTVLGRTGITLAKRAYGHARRRGDRTRGYFRTFLFAYAKKILERVDAERRRVEDAAADRATALVRIQNEAERFTNEMFKTTPGKKVAIAVNDGAYVAGRKAGEAARLGATGIDAAGAAAGIAPGRKRLPKGGV